MFGTGERGLALPLRTLCLLGLLIGTAMAAGQDNTAKQRTARSVILPNSITQPSVVVCEFYTHGELRPDGKNLAVYDDRIPSTLVPWKILQIGPGDFCRVAFQTTRGKTRYRIYYGGPEYPEKTPPWTSKSGLLLETRAWKACNLNDAKSVAEAFESSTPIGSDFVQAVSFRANPCAPHSGPFLSRFRGTLQIPSPGKYQFFTASEDCSFVAIDGQVILAAPGRHHPVRDGRIKSEVTLASGPHAFEYLHAAAGEESFMLVAWQTPSGKKPELIPPSAFAAQDIALLPTSELQHGSQGPLPDFRVEITSELTLEGLPFPLIHARFQDHSNKRISERARYAWDFGDGQTSDKAEPEHVFFRPGIYPITLKIHQSGFGSKSHEVTNRVSIHRPGIAPTDKKESHQLADSMPILLSYDAAKLAPENLHILMQLLVHAERYDAATRGSQAAFAALKSLEPSQEESVLSVARLTLPILRDRSGDAAGALAAWQAIRKATSRPNAQAESDLEAADILLNDLLRRHDARPHLDSAAKLLSGQKNTPLQARLLGLWCDFHARGGDGKAARETLQQLQELPVQRNVTEWSAKRGAFSRSAEAFLRDKEFDRAIHELRLWQQEAPIDRQEGYLSLLMARYWIARNKLPIAIAVANDLITLNPDCPYADQLAFLAAECEEKLGRLDRAKASFQAILRDYPGSPLVPIVKQRLAGAPAPNTKPKPQ